MKKINEKFIWIGKNGCNTLLGMVETGKEVILKNPIDLATLLRQKLIKEVQKSSRKSKTGE